MKKIMLLVGMGVCALTQAESLGQLSISNMMDEKFESFTVRVENRGDRDLYCHELSFEAIYMDTESYVEVAQEFIPIVDFYVRKKEEYQPGAIRLGAGQIKLIRKQYPGAVLKSVRLDLDLSDCEEATFELFAEFAPKTKDEHAAINIIRSKFGGKRLNEIQEKIPHIDRLGLKETGLKTVKPLEFFFDLDVLDISKNSVSNLAPLAELMELRKLDLSYTAVRTLAPLFPRNDKLAIKAKGVNLRNPSELDSFRKAGLIITHH
ncbi:hypothetical protein GW915_09725 [bacterium]|nr:hypothetical protein [bacterium]